MKKHLWLILILAIIVAVLFFGGAEKLMIWYYANKSGQDVAKVEEYFNKADEYQQKVKDDVNNFDYLVESARAYEYAGDVNKAISVYKDYAENVGDDVFYVYHNNLGKLYEKKGEWDKAIVEYTAIDEKFGKQYSQNYLNLANAYLEIGNKAKASENYFKYKSATGQQDGAFELRIGD